MFERFLKIQYLSTRFESIQFDWHQRNVSFCWFATQKHSIRRNLRLDIRLGKITFIVHFYVLISVIKGMFSMLAKLLPNSFRLTKRCDVLNLLDIALRKMSVFVPLCVDIVKVDASAWWKISKCRFFKDIENSFNEATHIGLEPHHFFLFKISQQIQSLEAFKVSAKMGRSWLAGWVMAKIF